MACHLAGFRAIFWTNVRILLKGSLGTNVSEILTKIYILSSEILTKIYILSLKKMYLKMSLWNWWQFCLDLNVLKCVFAQQTTLWLMRFLKQQLSQHSVNCYRSWVDHGCGNISYNIYHYCPPMGNTNTESLVSTRENWMCLNECKWFV